jgi:hypothetical protein
MDNQKRKVLIVLVIFIVITVAGIASKSLFIKKVQAPVVQPVAVQPVEPVTETPVAQNLYDNVEDTFEIKLLDGWKTISQSNDAKLSQILFYAGENADAVSGSANPLLTLISNKIPYASLAINRGDFSEEKFYFKNYVISGSGGVEGGAYTDKLLSWEEKVTNHEQKFYKYTKEIEGQSATRKIGVIWIFNGKLFELSSNDLSQEAVIENMALSFIPIS